MASLIVALFFPYNLSPLFGLESYPAFAIDIIFYLFKVLIIIIFSVTLIRVAVARLKIDQIVYTYWVPLTLMALVGLILVMWEGMTIQRFGWEPLINMLGF
jgi:NADH:ubiquinone oxidoreductase subunit H